MKTQHLLHPVGLADACRAFLRGVVGLTSLLAVGFTSACGDGAAPGFAADGARPSTDGGADEGVTGPNGAVNSPQGGTIGTVTPALSDEDFANQFSAPNDRPTAPVDTIAYLIRGEEGASVRLISGDGNDDREILSIPSAPWSSTATPQAIHDPVIVDELEWRPDGTELAFTSSFEVGARRGEIYAVTVDGSNLRRLTGVPRPIAYPNYDQGTVEVSVQHPDTRGGVSIGYFEGAQQAFGWLASLQDRRTIRFEAADFGEGVLQQAVLVSTDGCYDDPASDVDVSAGETTAARQLLPPLILEPGYPCALPYSPQWVENGTLFHLLRAPIAKDTSVNFSPAFSLLRRPVEDLSPTTRGDELTRYTALDRRGNTYFDVVDGGQNEFLFLRFRPDPPSDEFLIFGKVNSALIVSEDRAFVGRLGSPDSANLSRLMICPDAPNCDLKDAEWIPGENAFVYSSVEDLNRSSLRVHAVQSGAVVRETLVQVANGELGALAVSPDGQRIVVEQTFAGSAQTELWMFERSSGAFRQFAPAGAAPAWR